MIRAPLIHHDALQAAWEAFLLVRAMGGCEFDALIKAIDACDASRADAVRKAIQKKFKHAEAA